MYSLDDIKNELRATHVHLDEFEENEVPEILDQINTAKEFVDYARRLILGAQVVKQRLAIGE